MVIDSSALIAILKDEPEADSFATAIENDSTRLLSAASFLEVVMVIEGRYVPIHPRGNENIICQFKKQLS